MNAPCPLFLNFFLGGSGGARGPETLRTCFFAPIRSESARAGKFAGRHGAAAHVGVPSAPLPRGRRRQRSHAGARASLSPREGDSFTLKRCTSFSKNFGPVHLARQRGRLGPEARVSGRSGETLCAGAALRCSRRRPVRGSPRAVAAVAAAAAASRSPGGLREGTLEGARSPLAPASEAGRRGAERERESETVSSAARPQLCEPLQERRGGRWAGGRAGRAVTHIHGAGGEGARAQGNPTPGGPGEGGAGGGVWRALDPGSGPAGAWLGKPPGAQGAGGALPPRRTPAAPGPRQAGGAGRAEGPRLQCGRPLRSPRGPGPARRAAPGSWASRAASAAEAGKTLPPPRRPLFGRTLLRSKLKFC